MRNASVGSRMIVGIIDDDIILRGQYVGDVRIFGTLFRAPEIIKKLDVDTFVIACEFPPKWMKIVRQTVEPTGVKIKMFSLSEETLAPGIGANIQGEKS
ncbi:MAG: hypothetical protein IKD42_04325 [Kiritimatiellae bacterium]|nr:hypothetical protein [Kiritimatiellia bacterium]